MHALLYGNGCPLSSRQSINTIFSCRGLESGLETSDEEGITNYGSEEVGNELPNKELVGETSNAVGISNNEDHGLKLEYNNIGE